MRRLSPLLLAASAATLGCVVALPIEEEEVAENTPPFYDPTSLAPSPSDPAFDPETSESMEWCVNQVRDANLGDRLYVRWFIDYGPGNESPIEFGKPDGLVQIEDGHRLCMKVNPCQNSDFVGALDGTQLHTIELVVADRPFLDSSVEPRFRALPDDARFVVITWFLQFDKPCTAD